MTNDSIVDEIHHIRAQLLAQHGGNFAAYFASLMQQQASQAKPYASFATDVSLSRAAVNEASVTNR